MALRQVLRSTAVQATRRAIGTRSMSLVSSLPRPLTLLTEEEVMFKDSGAFD